MGIRERRRAAGLGVALALALSARPSRAQDAEADVTSSTIAGLQRAMDAGMLSSVRLVELSLARIEAYDAAGPALNAIVWTNPRAVERARELDAERRRSGPRSPLHGIPVLLKDNLDTGDMPTAAGSVLLAGSIPPDDAFLVAKLRDAGAVILAKTNMSELASGDAQSSTAGRSRNPHALDRSPSGSSIGAAVGVAAAYAPLGIGTDTGGSIRLPAAVNGIVGLRPTHGLLSRDGIVPLSAAFDTAGPMARRVEDVALALGVLTGVDPADAATAKSAGRFETDYTRFLDRGALAGARIGVARQFFGHDPDVDWVMEASLDAMRAAGATLVDVRFPEWLLRSRVDLYWTLRHRDFMAEMTAYLGTLGPEHPKTVAGMFDRALAVTAPGPDVAMPNASRWHLLGREKEAGTRDEYDYLAVRDHGLGWVRAVMEGLFAGPDLDAIVYPTQPLRTTRLDADPPRRLAGGSALNATMDVTPTNLASLAGFPDLSVPAGFTSSGLPVGISFLGTAFSEPVILALGYAFEQRTRALRLPVSTPPLD